MPGTTTREKNQGHAVSVGPSVLWPNLWKHDLFRQWRTRFLFVCLLFVPPSSQLYGFLTCDTAIWLWICNVCTIYNRDWCNLLPRVLHYLAHSREQYYNLNGKHTKSYLQCIAQGFFIVQILLMKSTQISPLACSSKINAKAFIYNYMSFSKD